MNDPAQAAKDLPSGRRRYDDPDLRTSAALLRSESVSSTLTGASTAVAWLACAADVLSDRPDRLRHVRHDLAELLDELLDVGDLIDAQLAGGLA
jgi:hypothetical protein